MDKLILGLDIGVSSVGFALLREKGNGDTSIERLGVRIVTEDKDFHGNFYTGNTASKNAGRRITRGARRTLDRYQLRRDKLIQVLNRFGMMPDEDMLLRMSSLELFELRDRAVREQISLRELGRIFYHLNQKRGFKSSRKSATEEDNATEYKQMLSDNHEALGEFTIGQYFYKKLMENPMFRIKENIFYRADYQSEFDRIWTTQKQYYPEILTGSPGQEDNRGTLYRLIRNDTIYYQRRLKSAKHLIGKCTFEPVLDSNVTGSTMKASKRVMPKSHPLYQEFRLWQQINNLRAKDRESKDIVPTEEQRYSIWRAAHNLKDLDGHGNLTAAKLKKILLLPKDYALNYEKIEGNKTWRTLQKALEKAGVQLAMTPLGEEDLQDPEAAVFTKLWHCTYSFETEKETSNALVKNFGFTKEAAEVIASSTGYTSDYGSISARAARKLLPHLWKGFQYDKAVIAAGYEHHSHFEVKKHTERLMPVKPNTLKNPVVEQVLNQVVNVVNCIADDYGKPDEVRVELARELKQNAIKRQRTARQQRQTEAANRSHAERLLNEHNFKRVNGRDLLRYRLWLENDHKCIYCGQPIPFTDVYNGKAEIEHIVPRSRLFSNAMSNLVLAHTSENREKGQMTAFDYLQSKGEAAHQTYVETVNELLNSKKITVSKHKLLLTSGEDIPNDFLDRQLNDTQYIAREAVSLLKTAFPKVYTTTGSITDLLKEKWQLNHLLEEINLPVYREAGLTEPVEIKDKSGQPKTVEKIKGFNKRSDHRHHAVDALVIALTKQSYIQRLNTLNQHYQKYQDLKESPYDFALPMANLRDEARAHLERMLISFKKPGAKVLTRKTNRIRTAEGVKLQTTWVPRGSLHEDTLMGRIKRYLKADWKTAIAQPQNIIDAQVRSAVLELIQQQGDPKKALAHLKKNNLQLDGVEISNPLLWEYRFTKRVKLNEQLSPAKVDKIIDPIVRDLVRDRIKEAGSIKAAFKEYASNPIFYNRDKQIPIKSVTVFDDGNLEQLREGYVYLKGNHHALIYRNHDGVFQERIVSFWEAVALALQNLRDSGSIYPIIDRRPLADGFDLYCSIQLNDLFLIDCDPFTEDESQISKKAFRVQTISSGDYRFRQQFQTNVEVDEPFAFRRINSIKRFANIHKIRLNGVGRIIRIGE